MEELDLKELFMMFWNKKVQIILIIAIFAVIGVIYTMGFVTPKYTSSTTLVLAGQNSTDKNNEISSKITTTDITLNSKLLSTYNEVVTSTNVVRQVISNLGINIGEGELKKSIQVSSVKDADLIKISVTNNTPEFAMKIANEIANVFVQEIAKIYNINNLHVLDVAEQNNTPSNINHGKDIIIFAFLGIVVAIVYVLILNMLDNTIKTREEVERIFKIPVIAEIPLSTIEKGGKK